MPLDPIQGKDFILAMQVYVSDILEKYFPTMLIKERLDLANEIMDYAFGLMLKTHTGDKIQNIKESEDDIPF